MRSHGTMLLLAALAVVPLASCSLSDSAISLSKSVGSSSDSSSSSSPAEVESSYGDDVADYTRAYAQSHRGDFDGFQADLAHLAKEHGITNWEENPGTYTAIGRGLRNANVSEAELMAYERNLSGGDPVKADAIQRGYDAAH